MAIREASETWPKSRGFCELDWDVERSFMPVMTLSDGGSFSYVDEGTGRPVLFLHGWGTNSVFFKKQIDAFQADFRVIAPDFRGHGLSSALPADGNVRTLADDLANLIKFLNLKDVLVCAWSMGSMVLWDLLLNHSEVDVSQYVVIDMTPKVENGENWELGLQFPTRRYEDAQIAGWSKEDWLKTCDVFLRKVRPSDSRDAIESWALEESGRCDPSSMYRLWNSLMKQDFRADLAALVQPVLLVHGKKSQLYDAETCDWLAGSLPCARCVGFDHSGHAPHLDEAERFQDEVMAFATQSGTSTVDKADAKTASNLLRESSESGSTTGENHD